MILFTVSLYIPCYFSFPREAWCCNAAYMQVSLVFISQTNLLNLKIYDLPLHFLSKLPEFYKICSTVNLEKICCTNF